MRGGGGCVCVYRYIYARTLIMKVLIAALENCFELIPYSASKDSASLLRIENPTHRTPKITEGLTGIF